MSLRRWIRQAHQLRASDLHLEPGSPLTVRVQGGLQRIGEPLSGRLLLQEARALLGEAWSVFLQQRSYDLSRSMEGVRCRINVMQSARGVGFAIRILSSVQPTLSRLNLHPALHDLTMLSHGLILVCGPTGSGKSSTLAAMIHEINLQRACHIVTIEHPIEFLLRPRQALIRQREVGRDTPSVERALIDVMREDPDVLMVGEMRDPETMRLTLNVAETGHLVLATMHSSSCAEAIQRMVSAFPPETQASVRVQLADCLQAVLCQRLLFRRDLDLRVPECEILRPSSGVRNMIREGQFFKIPSALETGARDGMWTFARYGAWLEEKTEWSTPKQETEVPLEDDFEQVDLPPLSVPLHPSAAPVEPVSPARRPSPPRTPKPRFQSPPDPMEDDDVIELEPMDEDLSSLIKQLEKS